MQDKDVNYFDMRTLSRLTRNGSLHTQSAELSTYSVHGSDLKMDADYAAVSALVKLARHTPQVSREGKALAVFLGNALGDSLGAHTEFQEIDPSRVVLQAPGSAWKDLEAW